MPDEALRAVIEELQNCASPETKIQLLTEQLRSIADLRELLPFFEQGELPAVFALMKGPERAFLKQWALQQDPPPEWVELLFE